VTREKLYEAQARVQKEKREFVERSKARDQRLRWFRKAFQEGELAVQVFRHLSDLLRAEQRKDERRSGFSFSLSEQ
jgi:hypothetical protein